MGHLLYRSQCKQNLEYQSGSAHGCMTLTLTHMMESSQLQDGVAVAALAMSNSSSSRH